MDVWAIGCLFVEMLTGMPLFPGQSDIDTLHLILKFFSTSLTEKQRRAFESNPLYKGMKVGVVSLFVASGAYRGKY